MLVYLIFSLFVGLIASVLFGKTLVGRTGFGIGTTIGVFLICLVFLPQMNIYFFSPYFIIIFAIGMITLFDVLINEDDVISKNCFIILAELGIMVFGFLFVFFISHSMFRSKVYHNILQVTNASDSMFVNKIKAIDVKNMVSVDKQFALKYANSLVGNIPGLGSRVEVVDAFRQTLNGTLIIDGKDVVFQNQTVWVAPLEHRGFFKWFYN